MADHDWGYTEMRQEMGILGEATRNTKTTIQPLSSMAVIGNQIGATFEKTITHQNEGMN
ncbi:hypothetical protein RUM44_011806 [Polyplax serrata]|uniref:Uncharacterized protein n=1 Tax=Polyplax serrata TaxID=468196 RepID=A0ABR1AR36_POLSC